MKPILVVLLSLFSINISAQTTWSVSGTIKNSKGEKAESVTVFIDGSSRATKTDINGYYEFSNLIPGTYYVATSMIGYASEKKSILLKNSSINLDFTIRDKSIMLDEVSIGNDSRRAEMLQTFKDRFLGHSDNARNCEILNTEVLEFSTTKTVLMATSGDFLIIENKNLGYRIKYLLKKFSFNSALALTSYDGDCFFEDLPGTERQKKKWSENRRKVYEGSFMHYLRCLYEGNLSLSKFKTLEFVGEKGNLIKKDEVDMNRYVSRIDSNFVKLSVKKRFYVTYGSLPDLSKVKIKSSEPLDRSYFADLELKKSEFNLYLEYTIVDKNGNYLDYRSFLLGGYWGGKQIGDRLPFSYSFASALLPSH